MKKQWQKRAHFSLKFARISYIWILKWLEAVFSTFQDVAGLSLIFQVDGELYKVVGAQKSLVLRP